MKKFSKKTVALVLVVTMLLAFVPSSSFADEPADPKMILKMDSDYHKKGDEFTMEVWVYNSSFNVAGFCLEFDPKVVAPVSTNVYKTVSFDEYNSGKGIFVPTSKTLIEDGKRIMVSLYVSQDASDKPAYPAKDNEFAREVRVGSEGYLLAEIRFKAVSDGKAAIAFAKKEGDAEFGLRSCVLGYKGKNPEDLTGSYSFKETPYADAEAFINAVKEIGTVTMESENEIALALKQYDELSDLSKKLASSAKAELDEKKAQLDKILSEMGDEDIAKKVISDLQLLDKTTADDLAELEAGISVVKKAYEALTEEQKALVNAEVNAEKILSDAAARLAEAKEKNKVEEVTAAITEISKIAEITLDHAEKVDSAKEAYDSLSENGKKLISDELKKVLDDAVAKIGELRKNTYTLGDTNSDGEVDAKDATQILRYVNGKAASLDKMDEAEMLATADINSDKSVDAKDATQILRHVNGKASALDQK